MERPRFGVWIALYLDRVPDRIERWGEKEGQTKWRALEARQIGLLR